MWKPKSLLTYPLIHISSNFNHGFQGSKTKSINETPQRLTIWHTRPRDEVAFLTPWFQDSRIIENSIKTGIKWHNCSFRTFSLSDLWWDQKFLSNCPSLRDMCMRSMRSASDFAFLKKKTTFIYCIICICVIIDPKTAYLPISLNTCPPPRMADLPKTQWSTLFASWDRDKNFEEWNNIIQSTRYYPFHFFPQFIELNMQQSSTDLATKFYMCDLDPKYSGGGSPNFTQHPNL